jgi:hypothetical protein
MQTTRTKTHRSLALAAVGTALVSTVLFASSGPAHADGPGDQQTAYVNSLLAQHNAATSYTEMDDYVRTLLFWHQNLDWYPAN